VKNKQIRNNKKIYNYLFPNDSSLEFSNNNNNNNNNNKYWQKNIRIRDMISVCSAALHRMQATTDKIRQ